MLVRSTHISIGIDVGKARNATTVADAERGGEVRFIGEVDASPDAICEHIRSKTELFWGKVKAYAK